MYQKLCFDRIIRKNWRSEFYAVLKWNPESALLEIKARLSKNAVETRLSLETNVKYHNTTRKYKHRKRERRIILKKSSHTELLVFVNHKMLQIFPRMLSHHSKCVSAVFTSLYFSQSVLFCVSTPSHFRIKYSSLYYTTFLWQLW